MEWMLLPLKRYADFSGRSRRMEYWMFTLGLFILYVVFAALLFTVGDFSGFDDGSLPGAAVALIVVFGIVMVGLFLPILAVQVRRLHDQDKSGWFILLNFIPYIGGLVLFIFMCLPGTPGENRYGPDPLGYAHPEQLTDVFR